MAVNDKVREWYGVGDRNRLSSVVVEWRKAPDGLGDLCAMRAKCAPNVRHVKVRCKSDLNLCETQMSANMDFSPRRY